MQNAANTSEIVGRNLRRIREESGASQDEIARLIRTTGLRWPRSTVAMAEAGQKALSLDEIVLLALALCGGQVDQLFAGDDIVRLGIFDLPLEDLRGIIASEPGASSVPSQIASIVGTVAGMGISDSMSKTGLASAATGEAEQKAARNLHCQVEEINLTAARLWGRSLTQERDARLAALSEPDFPARSIQALRGHITRALLEELEPALKGD